MTTIKIEPLNEELEVSMEEADAVVGGDGAKSRVVFVGGWGSSMYQYG